MVVRRPGRALALLAVMGMLVFISALIALPLQAQWLYAVDVGYCSTPIIDGSIGLNEYMGASEIEFDCYGGTCLAYVGHDTTNLYVAFALPDTTPYPYNAQGDIGPAAQVFVDKNNDKATSVQTDDLRLTIDKGNNTSESVGTSSGSWRGAAVTNWSGTASTHAKGWHAEFSISFAKLGLTPGTAKTIGLTLANVWTAGPQKDYYWPDGGFWNKPNTWGEAYSNADWESWSFKAGGWIEYAPNGVPDFSQKLDLWGQGAADPALPGWQWTYCGPVAAANSLWWFDAKFEPSPVPVPPFNHDDDYYLVTEYPGAFGDEDPVNVGGIPTEPGQITTTGLVDDLAWYFDTDGIRTPAVRKGTEVHDMSHGLQWFLYGDSSVYPQWHSQFISRTWSHYDDYHVQLVKMPTWDWVVEEVKRSEDVVLLLGFWQLQESVGWVRLGGHYVTIAGVNDAEPSSPPKIALSDPYLNNAEIGGLGRVLSGTILLPHNPGHLEEFLHNDAGNVSHDYYTVTLAAISPGGLWEIDGYPYIACPLGNFEEQNCPKEFISSQDDCIGEENIFVEVEYALAMSPFYWKPGGEWVDTWWQEEWLTEFWRYEDDGHSCLPDFLWEASQDFYYDGPVSVANSFWWFDSKAETLLTGGFPTAPEPGAKAVDHYSMTEAYGDWDDHAISNTVPFISDLAQNYLETSLQGTTIASMTAGIDAYLAKPGVAGDFYTKTQNAPTWEWIADEVETCEDVVLLLGFYEGIGDAWERKGGHWVNAAGVSRESMFIGLSDPTIDNANSETVSNTMYLGRVFPPEHLGVAFTKEEKRDPQSISHDIYHLTSNVDLEDRLVLEGYPFTVTSVLSNYVGLNGADGCAVQDWSHPFTTVVEWAIGVSPYSELVITKTAAVTEVVPGDWVTFTIEYMNRGLAAAEEVSITDMMPSSVLTVVGATSYPQIDVDLGPPIVWTRPRLSFGQTGTLTITAQALVTAPLTNTVYITGLTAIDNATPDKEPANNVSKIGPDCVDLTSITIGGSEGDAPGAYTLTTSYEPINASQPITYQWDNGDATPNSMRILDVGAHTLTVTATNCTLALVTDTHTITITEPPCVDLEIVEMDLVSTAPICVDEVVEFQTVVTPSDATTPFTYTLDVDGLTGAPMTATVTPFTFTQTFATTGTHTVNMAAWNCSMGEEKALTDTISFEVVDCPTCVEVELVELELISAVPIKIDTPAVFQAVVTPSNATTPFTYTLDVDGLAGLPQTATGVPLTSSQTFSTTGAHTIEIDIWNCSMTAEEAATDSLVIQAVGYQVYLPVVLKSN